MAAIENLTIMFTDIVDYSRMVSELSRQESGWLLKQHDKILERIIKRFGGNIIKSLGDAFLVSFRSPTDAILCAMAIQDTLWEFNQDNKLPAQLQIRVAINTGEVRIKGNDIFGEAVNIASRLEGVTPANAIYLTESVYLSMHKTEVELEVIGNHAFKGVDYPVMIYEVSQQTAEDSFPFGGAHIHRKPAGLARFTVGRVFIGLCATIITAFITWWATISYMPAASDADIEKLTVEYGTPVNFAQTSAINPITVLDDLSYEQAKLHLKNGNYLLLKKLVNDNLAVYPNDGYLHMLHGHVTMYFKKYKQAVRAYNAALREKPVLANDQLLSNNLVKLIDIERLEANRLLGQYLSNPMITALGKRSGQQGLRGRYDAFYLLKDSGNVEQVDTVGLNIWDLKELQECKLKKIAATELKRLNDPRALDALKSVKKVNLVDNFKYLCLWPVVDAAIAALEKPKKTASTTNLKPSTPQQTIQGRVSQDQAKQQQTNPDQTTP
ncbi:MAG: adenylate/guanylate cyclase domain-containing protein [Cellvibrionaceae bacterium]|nr:adenylate/guanylate cyclase domain-containing protein [Cellvibrionaceae bacterium]